MTMLVAVFVLIRPVEISTVDNTHLIKSFFQGDTKMWSHIFSTQNQMEIDGNPMGVIVPSSILPAMELERFYEGLRDVSSPVLIVLLAGNSLNAGNGNIQTCRSCIFKSIDGEINLSNDKIYSLISRNIASDELSTFQAEESVFVHTPYLKHFFPNAELLPIIIKDDTSIEELLTLRDFLYSDIIGQNVLFIASTNFSSGFPIALSAYHDQYTTKELGKFSLKNIFNLDVDSKPALYMLMSMMEKYENRKTSLVFNISSQKFSLNPQEKTSYFSFWTFNKEDPVSEATSVKKSNLSKPEAGVNILSVGNIKSDADLGVLAGWNFANIDSFDSVNLKQFRDIRGENDNFFLGNDFIVFDVPDGQCIQKIYENFDINFCKYSSSESEVLKDQLKTIRELRNDKSLIYLLYGFSGSEEENDRKKIARQFIDNGVDIFVGRGISEVLPIEYYRKSLIIYSLGDFLTDSKLANELTSNSSGMIAGINISENNYGLYLYPIDIVNGYPKLKSFIERIKINMMVFTDLHMTSRFYTKDENNGIVTFSR